MALSTKAKQKKQAKKAAKRKERLHEKNAASKLSPQEKLMIKVTKAGNSPIHQCLVPEILFKAGMGQLVMSRKLSETRIGMGVFLLDTWCKGVKDCFFIEIPVDEYEIQIKKLDQVHTLNEVTPAYFKKLVTEAVEFAKAHDFPTHGEYIFVKKLFADIDEKQCTETFEYGKDGKPYLNETSEEREQALFHAEHDHVHHAGCNH